VSDYSKISRYPPGSKTDIGQFAGPVIPAEIVQDSQFVEDAVFGKFLNNSRNI
jgi:hypothetical protein